MKKIFFVFFIFLSLFLTGCSQNVGASYYFYVANNNILLFKNQIMPFGQLNFITNLPSTMKMTIKSNDLNIVKIEENNIVAISEGSTTIVVDAIYQGNNFTSNVFVNINKLESEEEQEVSEQNLLNYSLFSVKDLTEVEENLKLFCFNILKNDEITGNYNYSCSDPNISIYRDGQMLNVVVSENYNFFVTIFDSLDNANFIIVDFNEYVNYL